MDDITISRLQSALLVLHRLKTDLHDIETCSGAKISYRDLHRVDQHLQTLTLALQTLIANVNRHTRS
jgi:hypothetical protein